MTKAFQLQSVLRPRTNTSFAERVRVLLRRACPALLLCMTSCLRSSSGPEEIVIGQDECHQCRMIISDFRFGGEIRTSSGKVRKFDSLGCLLSFYRKNKGAITSVWVVDSFTRGTLIDAHQAHFSVVESLHGPMGAGVLSSTNLEKLKEAAQGAPMLDWDKVQLVFSE